MDLPELGAFLRSRRDEDPEVARLVTQLQASSEEFADLWTRRDVRVRRADRKRLVHPELGVMEVDCLTLLSEDGTQRLLWFTPTAGSPAREQFAALAAAARLAEEVDGRPASLAHR